MNAIYRELLLALRPEASLVFGALVALGADLALGRGKSQSSRLYLAAAIGMLALLAAFCFTIAGGTPGSAFGGTFALDTLTLATRGGVLLLTSLALALSAATVRLRNPAEYIAIILFATCGFTLMAAAQNLLVAFLAVELASLSLYVLAGFDKTRAESAEAALKYFLFGGISAAFLLFGFSLLYGLTGAIEFPEIARQLSRMNLSPLLVVALVMILVAFGFKAAAAPFHLWAPDTYEGAPPMSAALIASASKLAGFMLFVRLLWQGAAPVAGSVATIEGSPGWLPVLAVIAVASLILGNVAALAQSNVRRLLAYSAIAHAGALVLGVMVAGSAGPGPVFYYAATYGIATMGVFGVIAVVDRASGCHRLTDLAALHRRSPLLAGCLAIFVLSLAGIPPLAGFFGKFVVFAAALKLGGLGGVAGWLAVLAIFMSAVALYYYLLILKQALVVNVPKPARIAVPVDAAIALIAAALLVILFGVFPSVVLRMLN